MRSLLEEFWYGNVFLQEQYTRYKTNTKELLRILDKNRTQLSDTLTEVQKEILQKYDDAVTDMNDIMERELFIYAFRLGGRFVVETLTGKENN